MLDRQEHNALWEMRMTPANKQYRILFVRTIEQNQQEGPFAP